MKKMRMILTLAIVALMSMTMSAQRHKGLRGDMSPEKRVEQRADRLAKDLSLTDKQRAEIKQILNDEAEQMRANRPEGEGKRDRAHGKEMMEKMKAQREATDAKIAAVLTPEQQAKYEEMKANRPERPQGRPGGKRHGKGGDCCGKSQTCDKAQGTCDKAKKACDKAKKACDKAE